MIKFAIKNEFENKNKIKKLIWIDYLLIISIFFPWLSFRLNDLDSQPWAFFACLIYLSFQKIIPINNLFRRAFLLLIPALSILIISGGSDPLLLARSIIGYSQIFLVALCIYVLKRSGKDCFKTLLIINYIWLVAAFLQAVENPYIFDFLVTVRTSETRGVTSLAPEPTFFAVFIIVISWIIIKESHLKNLDVKVKFLLFFNFLSVIFLAKSSMGALYIVAIFFLWFVFRMTTNIRQLILATLAIALILPNFDYLIRLLPASRLLDVTLNIKNSLLISIENDASINQRLSHIYYSIGGFIDGFGLPYGLNSFKDYARGAHGSYKYIFWSTPGDKIMSWAGAMFFELGFIGLFLFLIMQSFMWGRRELSLNIFIASVFAVISLAAIPHGFSPLAALIGFYAADKRKIKNQRENHVDANQRQ